MKKEEISKEEMLEEIKKHKQKMQLDFINDLLDRVEHYVEKRSKTSYIVSIEETMKFEKIYHMIMYINEKL